MCVSCSNYDILCLCYGVCVHFAMFFEDFIMLCSGILRFASRILSL